MFEIAKTAGGYASTPTTLVSFNGANGADPDARPDRRRRRRPVRHDVGSAARTATARCSRSSRPPTGYASTPTTLVSFNGTNGAVPMASLIADANGDLFGTTSVGGANGDGTVFEIAKTADRLRQHAHHAGQLQRHQRREPRWQPDRRRQRQPVRHDRIRRGERRRHGVRDRQDRRRLRQHPHHAGQLQRHQRRQSRSAA